jgi:hypothetical protein
MTPHASSITTMPQTRPPDPLPAGPRLALADSPAAEQDENRRRPLEVAQCSLCGIALPLGLLVPDGGRACADIRWYCKDAKSCTERWTTARPRRAAALPAAPGQAVAGAEEPAPARLPAERLGGMPRLAQPVT